jgi:hypothetical protein
LVDFACTRAITVLFALIFACLTFEAQIANSTPPTFLVPNDIVAQCQNLYAKKDGRDTRRLSELLALYRGAGLHYDNMHAVFLPAFQSHSEEDLISEVILTPEGELKSIKLAGDFEPYLILELMRSIPFNKYKSALDKSMRQRIVTHTPGKKSSSRYLTYVTQYFEWIAANDREMATEIVLFAISRWESKSVDALTPLINKLPDLVDSDPHGRVKALMKELLSKSKEDISVLRSAYFSMNKWGDEAGITLLLENIEGPYGKRDISNMLTWTTYVPFVFRSVNSTSAREGTSQHWGEWWKAKGDCIHWDKKNSSWTAYQGDFSIPDKVKAVKWDESKSTYFYTHNSFFNFYWNWHIYYDERQEGCL